LFHSILLKPATACREEKSSHSCYGSFASSANKYGTASASVNFFCAMNRTDAFFLIYPFTNPSLHYATVKANIPKLAG
jgi:hypothetical protein